MFDYHSRGGTPRKPRTAVENGPEEDAGNQPDANGNHDDDLTTRTRVENGAGGGRQQKRLHSGVFIIGVSGGTASGKTTVCDTIMQRLHDSCVVMLSQDSFYRCLTEAERENVTSFNFDHPDAFDKPLLLETLQKLREGRPVQVPTYDFSRHTRSEEVRVTGPADVVVVEGILVLAMKEVREMCNMKIFVDTDDDLRLARRIQRDVACRGRDVVGVIRQYTEFVKPMFDQFVAPSRRHADVIIPWGKGENLVAIDLIVEHIRTKLQQPELKRIYPNLEVIPSNFQIQGMHTIIRDRNTSKEDFVFYADRLNRLVVEAGLGHLPFTERSVTTPTGAPYCGVAFARRLCGVSIIRSGEAMEAALRACCKGIKIGKILVHRHQDNNDVIYEKLPSDIADRHVMLMDPLLSTGATAVKAIQILKDRGVPEDRILFLTIIAAPEGIVKVCSTFPSVKLLTSEIDDCVDPRENFALVPGAGNYGDRYFCD
ncbi:hypothetical protein VOLCADRAFT_104172 [Volvox carteri f. nagariensis]|uniref:Uridine kinase n=1 Tax=Volvox carteri f. nagariensis TaxID=3068 RepID=D8TRX2_VOLCA|nr:uncharacterized protein VOLCADRAFT_104172 [Volvox carteri f. nagariensis]EFJ49721.1 hypothetical protein VOLCADRAFT_104172 [Volvox carteri f. nagariensis]|eukprot:XP_002949228.1 hypothetical protein VOLCADRAFT_104172 [Volvox carteri f. nagariensis]